MKYVFLIIVIYFRY